MATGTGLVGARRFGLSSNLAGSINSYQWHKYSTAQGHQSSSMYNDHLEIVNKCVRQAAHEHDTYSDDEGIMNVAVSYDGTWLTRGHSSNLGMGFVIDANTGFVLDHNILSRFCQACDRIKLRHANDPDRITEEIFRHKDQGHCLANFEGTSGVMEREHALRMWARSVEKNKMRYTQFISDGDSSAFRAVRDSDPYDGIDIEKQECINHVQKRLGSRLRKLKKETYTEIVSKVTGRVTKRATLGGAGKLTDNVIDRLTGYYGAAIRRTLNTTITKMKDACIAGFKHVTSTDANHDHEHCQEGTTSYCFYKKAIANGEKPQSHSLMKVSCSLDRSERQKVMQIYDDLTAPDLLQRCITGSTQNANESIHQKIWNKLPKTKHHGLKTAEYSTAQTVVEHNLGYEYALKHGSMKFDVEVPVESVSGSIKKDSERVRHSVRVKPKKKKYANAPQPDADYGAGDH